MKEIEIIKQDHQGLETFRYTGKILRQESDQIILEAFFNRDDTPIGEIVLRRGDRFVEKYFTDRWYNIFKIHEQASDNIKGWYCNIGYPAEIQETQISYRDLALDLLIYPDGEQLILDEDEFKALPLSPKVRRIALQALIELQNRFQGGPKQLEVIP
jgi:protein associated with RNAse G/E